MNDSIAKIVAEMRANGVEGGEVPSLATFLSWTDRLEAISNPKTRYPWEQAPKWAMWAATDGRDKHGHLFAFWYSEKPVIHNVDPCWVSMDGEVFWCHKPDASIDWHNSLEKRPEG